MTHHFHYLSDLDAFVCLPIVEFTDRQGVRLYECSFAKRQSVVQRDCFGCCFVLPARTIKAALRGLPEYSRYAGYHWTEILGGSGGQKQFFSTPDGLLIEVLIESYHARSKGSTKASREEQREESSLLPT